MLFPTQAPLIPSVLTDMFGHIFNHQESAECADFELRMVDCVEAYGMPRAMEDCRDLISDFHECVFSPLQTRRQMLMSEERERQYKSGLRKEQFEKSPPQDSF